MKGSVINDGSHDLLGMLSCIHPFLSWPRRFFRSSSFFTVKLHFHISSHRFLNYLYWNFFTFFIIPKSLVFQFPFLHVQIYIAQYSIKYCHWIDWWPVLKLDFIESSINHQKTIRSKLLFYFLSLLFVEDERFTYRILLMTFFENVLKFSL